MRDVRGGGCECVRSSWIHIYRWTRNFYWSKVTCLSPKFTWQRLVTSWLLQSKVLYMYIHNHCACYIQPKLCPDLEVTVYTNRVFGATKYYIRVFYFSPTELPSLLPVVPVAEALLRVRNGPHLLTCLIANMPDQLDSGEKPEQL